MPRTSRSLWTPGSLYDTSVGVSLRGLSPKAAVIWEDGHGLGFACVLRLTLLCLAHGAGHRS